LVYNRLTDPVKCGSMPSIEDAEGKNIVRVLVFGAGAIGSLLGYRLAHAGHEVTLVGRQAYVRAVQERGLLLEEGSPPGGHHGDEDTVVTTSVDTTELQRGHVVYPDAVERIEDIPADQRSWDLVLLTVKAYDTTEAAQALAPYSPPDVPLLIVQNGVGGEELAQDVLKHTEVVSGVLTLSVSVLAPGHIRLETRRGGLSLAPTRDGQSVEQWAALFAAADMRVATYADYRALKWSKLLLNVQANAIPAILDMTPGDVFADPALFALERSAFLEALAVMQALHLRPVSFPGYPVPLLAWAMRTLPTALLRLVLGRLVASGRGDKPPSLQMGLSSGRQRSEVRHLNGAVVTHAQRLGLDVPVNKVLMNTLVGMVAGSIPWEKFRGQPQRLVAAVYAAKE